jgi:MtfA peptidase
MIQTIVIIFSVVVYVTLLYIIIRYKRRPLKPAKPIDETDRILLKQYVNFYNRLEPQQQDEFEKRMIRLLSSVKITGVNTQVDRLDELFIAASAIIPIFGFHNWEYMNLNEVLLYPGSFDQQFNQQGEERTRAGVVGDGPYQNMMILSQYDLRMGFMNAESKYNTGIHEFVHLVDKTDGAVDGIPRSLMSQQYVLPWLNLMQHNIQKIRDQQSDIDPYGSLNQAEFLAVASEYFFGQPEQLQQNHPELYTLLSKIFNQHSVAAVDDSAIPL